MSDETAFEGLKAGDIVSVTFEGEWTPSATRRCGLLKVPGSAIPLWVLPADRPRVRLIRHALPPEPPIGSVIESALGGVWQRRHAGWCTPGVPGYVPWAHFSYPWKTLRYGWAV